MVARDRTKRDERARLQIAQEAARLMAEGGVSDFRVAKQRAARKLGIRGAGGRPWNLEIEVALMEYQ